MLLTQLKDNVVALTAKETDLTQTITRLTAKCDEQDRGSADRIKELDVTKQKNVRTAKQLEDLQKRYAELEKEALERASAPDKSVAAIALMTAAAEETKKEFGFYTLNLYYRLTFLLLTEIGRTHASEYALEQWGRGKLWYLVIKLAESLP